MFWRVLCEGAKKLKYPENTTAQQNTIYLLHVAQRLKYTDCAPETITTLLYSNIKLKVLNIKYL